MPTKRTLLLAAPAALLLTACGFRLRGVPEFSFDVLLIAAAPSSTLARELQLRLRVKFRVRGANGSELIPETELLQQRDISYNETIALAKEAEEALLYRNMQTDIVQQLLRRLAVVKR